MTAEPTPEGAPAREDHFVILRGATWADYQRLRWLRGEKAVPRITYIEGTLQLMTPSMDHESIKSLFGRLVEVWCLEFGVDFSPVGSWTIEDPSVARGVEPDECYVFGPTAGATRPDLAIEVVWTSGGVDKLRVYAELGVREVWFWRRGVITPYVLGPAGYLVAERSECLLPSISGSSRASSTGATRRWPRRCGPIARRCAGSGSGSAASGAAPRRRGHESGTADIRAHLELAESPHRPRRAASPVGARSVRVTAGRCATS